MMKSTYRRKKSMHFDMATIEIHNDRSHFFFFLVQHILLFPLV